jgi:hypothetical protein
VIAVALWLAALCALVVLAAIATARARAKPDAIVERGWFVALAIAYVALVAGAAWTWGGARALDARDDRVRAGAQVALELRGIDVPLAKGQPISPRSSTSRARVRSRGSRCRRARRSRSPTAEAPPPCCASTSTARGS